MPFGLLGRASGRADFPSDVDLNRLRADVQQPRNTDTADHVPNRRAKRALGPWDHLGPSPYAALKRARPFQRNSKPASADVVRAFVIWGECPGKKAERTAGRAGCLRAPHMHVTHHSHPHAPHPTGDRQSKKWRPPPTFRRCCSRSTMQQRRAGQRRPRLGPQGVWALGTGAARGMNTRYVSAGAFGGGGNAVMAVGLCRVVSVRTAARCCARACFYFGIGGPTGLFGRGGNKRAVGSQRPLLAPSPPIKSHHTQRTNARRPQQQVFVMKQDFKFHCAHFVAFKGYR